MSTSSMPKLSTVTLGRGYTSTFVRPAAASSPICAGPRTVRGRTAMSPGWISAPGLRTNSPLATGRCGVTRLVPRSLHSSGNTASASVGSGAPVATRTAWRGCRRNGFWEPAGTSPTTGRARSALVRGRESRSGSPSSSAWRGFTRRPADPPTSTARTA